MKHRIQTLDGLRGVAIGMVLLSHASETIPQGWGKWLFFLAPFSNGENGVQIFFVLSGFLITSILLREFDATGRVDIKAFYCRRILRIFPAFYLFLLFIIGLNVAGVLHLSRTELGFAAAHLLNYGQAIALVLKLPVFATPDYHFIGHFWSLSMEEQFYWIWPISLLLLIRTRTYPVLLAVILAMPFIRIVSYFLFPDLRGQLMMMLHSASDGVFSGCLLAICFSRHPRVADRLRLPAWGVAGVVFYMYFLDDVFKAHMPRGYGITLGATLMLLAIVLVVANVLQQEPATWYHRFLSARPLVYLGRISYSVYLWQQIFLTSANTTVLGKFPLNLVASMAAGWVSYRCIELPFAGIKDRYFRARTGGKREIVPEVPQPTATS